MLGIGRAELKRMTSRKANRVIELDGIRGIAILLVLIWHYVCLRYIPSTPLFFYFYKPLLYAWSGVDLFFVLSGFLIGGILLDNREAPNYLRVFYVRRVCRIFPIYYLYLFVFFSLLTITPVLSVPSGPLPLWRYLTYTQNLGMAQYGSVGPEWVGITWSLAVEEQFYLTLPFLLRYVDQRRLPLVLSSLILTAPLLRLALPYTGLYQRPLVAAYVLSPCRADSLLLGVLSAYVIREDTYVKFLKIHGGLLYGSITTTSILAWLFLRPPVSFLGYFFLALMYALVLLIVLTRPKSPLGRLARVGWLRSLGTVAYGVYLLHRGIATLSHWVILGHASPELATVADVFVTLFALLLTLLAASASWVYLEKPLIAVGHRLHYNRSGWMVKRDRFKCSLTRARRRERAPLQVVARSEPK
jgi:peptidoglycan/LPS O-acetylase OafA/YrhL